MDYTDFDWTKEFVDMRNHIMALENSRDALMRANTALREKIKLMDTWQEIESEIVKDLRAENRRLKGGDAQDRTGSVNVHLLGKVKRFFLRIPRKT